MLRIDGDKYVDRMVDGRYTPRYRINDDRQINSISVYYSFRR
jgi:hypothetical protein